jgi:uncharacterized membrane protein YeaQ/YmgE (transglycosylase-associated protein family)
LNAKVLFTVAAIFNAVVGAAILLAYDALAPWLGLPPQPTVWVHLVALIVLVFGYAYWRVAMDPRRFRDYIVLGIVGKLAFVAVIYGHFLAGDAKAMLAALVTADLLFAGLFGAHLKRTPADGRR